MTLLWPRLPMGSAEAIFAAIEDADEIPSPSTAHPHQTFAQVGGRATTRDLSSLRDSVLDVAKKFGFPAPIAPDDRSEFDAAVAPLLHEHLPMTWSEAGSREVWSFMALVLLPDVTDWRWTAQGRRNRERWVASDLTRHTWARLWWIIAAFGEHRELAGWFNESELNQLVERRSIGGNPELLTSLASNLKAAIEAGAPRRALVRDSTRRIRRYLAFVDPTALDSEQMDNWTRSVVARSVAALAQPPNARSSTEKM